MAEAQGRRSCCGVWRHVIAVRDVSFTVEDGEFVSLLGPSGCGKTTTLRCIAGLEGSSGGTIRLGEATVAADGRDVPR